MAVPFGVYPMATSDKSGEFEQMQNQKLLNAEQEYASKAKGAQGLAGLGAGLMSAADQGLKAGMAVEDQMIDVQNLEEIYKKASENTQMMRDYAVSKLGLGPEEVKTYDPLIQSVILDSKKTRDPGSVFKFYDMVDKIAAQKEALEAKKKAGEKENVSAAISLKFAQIAEQYTQETGELAPDFNTLRTYAAEKDPELMGAYSMMEPSAQRAIVGDYSAGLGDIRKRGSEAAGLFQSALKMYTKDSPSSIMSQTGSVISGIKSYYKQAANLQTAIGRNDSETTTRIKSFMYSFLSNSGSNIVDAIQKAAIPRSAQQAMVTAQEINGPIWQLLMTHLRNTSGAAVTESEYARFATALGLTTANTQERMNSLAYFLGKIIASTKAKYNEASSIIGRSAGALNKKEGRNLPDYSTKVMQMVDKMASGSVSDNLPGEEKEAKSAEIDFARRVKAFAEQFEEQGIDQPLPNAEPMAAPKTGMGKRREASMDELDALIGSEGE